MHYTALEVQPPAHDAPPPRGRLIIISHAFTTIFATAWEFALPLALLAAYSQQGKDSLTAPAALTLAQTTTSMFLGPATGRWADKTERQRAMRLARCVQIAGTALSVAGARLLTSETYFNAHAGKILAAVLFGAVLETLGSLVTKAAPKKDWVPTLFGGDAYVDAQSRVTFYISNVSQVAGIVGPFLGSAALTWSVRDGAAVVGIAAIAAELPAQMLLEMLYAASPALQRAKQVDKLDAGGSAVSRGAWRAWLAQPSGSTFLTTSFALLFFTVLAPHGAVLTAYLAAMHVQPFAISLFRAFGAGAGLVGISLFSKLATVTIAISSRFDADVPGSASAARVTALRKASGVALIGQTCAVALATGALYLRHLFGHALFLFMVAVVFSRAGLYAYDVGYLELQQILVDESDRTACSGVESALCGAAELAVAIITVAAYPEPSQFQHLAFSSAACVLLSLLVFSVWAQLYHVVEHDHAQGCKVHPHTTQLARSLSSEDCSKHVHLHYTGPRVCGEETHDTEATPLGHAYYTNDATDDTD